MNPGIDDLLDEYDQAAMSAAPPHVVILLQCEGEHVAAVHDGRWLHRPCRHQRCTIGQNELGQRDRTMQRYHVYDLLTGQIVRNYDRKREKQKGQDNGIW